MADASADDVLFFDVVAKASSLTEAARELGVSVSSVSKRLTRIERRLGVHLIQRTTRRLALTTEGERYAAGAAVIAVELAGLEESLSEHGELVGRIRVHSTMGLGRAHIAPFGGRGSALGIRVFGLISSCLRCPSTSQTPPSTSRFALVRLKIHD